ncbi:MAG: ADOP family duplicated permease [Gemmatimonadota bacterium]
MIGRLRAMLRQLRTLVRKDAVEREQRAEMAFHVDMQAEQYLRAGMAPAEARRAAHVAFGGVERFREARRQASRVRLLDDLVADVRYGIRSLARRRGFTAAVTLTLGLGIGGTAAIFSVVDGLFLRAPAGTRDAERLRRVYIERNEGVVRTGPGGGSGSYLDYTALRDNLRGAAHVATDVAPRLVDLGRGAEAEQIRAGIVSANYFATLGVRPAAGRFFSAEEDGVEGTHPVVVVSHAFAERRLGGAAAAPGAALLLNGRSVTVLGVTEKAFTGLQATRTEAWAPTALAVSLGLMFEGWRAEAEMIAIDYVVRLRESVDGAALEREATGILTNLAEAHPGIDPTPVAHTSGITPAAGPGRSPAAFLSLLLAAVAGLVLIIACANVANLLLARGMTRRRETAVRLSLGATRGRVARQHLAESLVLAALGGAAGVALAFLGLALTRQFPLPAGAGRLDGRVLAFTATLSLATGLLFGLAPALRAGRVATVPALKESRLHQSVAAGRARRGLVALQVALCALLLVGAGLFIRSLGQVAAVDPGLDYAHVTRVSVDLGKAGFTPQEREAFYEAARARLDALPEVAATAMVHFHPFASSAYGIGWRLTGVEEPGFREGPYRNLASPGYFAAIGTRITAGRDFTAADRAGEPTAIVNERMARGLAPGGSALNLCVALGSQVNDGGCTRIVGVVEDYAHRFLEAADVPMIFLPRERDPTAITWGGPALIVRTRAPAAAAAAAVRAAVQGMRPDLPYVLAEPLTETVRASVLPYRLAATLFSIFGALALTLAAVGLYGVLGYFVAERTAEIGIRRSLGAPSAQVVRLVVRQGMVPVLAGLAVGLAAAWGATRVVGSLLFGVDARDPLTFAGAASFLLVVAALAALLPARRAAGVDPMTALRTDD